jgi:hypothetical protein
MAARCKMRAGFSPSRNQALRQWMDPLKDHEGHQCQINRKYVLGADVDLIIMSQSL